MECSRIDYKRCPVISTLRQAKYLRSTLSKPQEENIVWLSLLFLSLTCPKSQMSLRSELGDLGAGVASVRSGSGIHIGYYSHAGDLVQPVAWLFLVLWTP